MEYTPSNMNYCKTSAELFVLACERGYDSKDFVETLMLSDEGSRLYNYNSIGMWYSALYALEGLERECTFKEGIVINEDVMYWLGYLYRCWSLTYPEETAADIYRQAPFNIALTSYMGFHVMPYEMAIENFKEIYELSNTSKC